MAIGVGLLVGFGVRFFGAGVDAKFGFLGGFLALFACLLGNLFTQIGFAAQFQGLGYLQALQLFDYSYLPEIFAETFSGFDIIFYGIAIVEGYKFAFRSVSSEDLAALRNPAFDPTPPGYNLRKPAAIGAFVLFALILFKFNQGTDGEIIFKYEDGSNQSSGELVGGNEVGEWTYWYPNGKVQAILNFSNGVAHGKCETFYESGEKQAIGTFNKGFKNELWVNYYPEGVVSDSGRFVNDREVGDWYTYYVDGQLSQSGGYQRGYQDGKWSYYYSEGQLITEGEMKNGLNIGVWKSWNASGVLMSELNYLDDQTVETMNLWTIMENNWSKMVLVFMRTSMTMTKPIQEVLSRINLRTACGSLIMIMVKKPKKEIIIMVNITY